MHFNFKVNFTAFTFLLSDCENKGRRNSFQQFGFELGELQKFYEEETLFGFHRGQQHSGYA